MISHVIQQFLPRVQACFRVDAGYVGVGGRERNVQFLGHAFLGEARCVQGKNLCLSFGQEELPSHQLGIVAHHRMTHIGDRGFLVKPENSLEGAWRLCLGSGGKGKLVAALPVSIWALA